MQVGTGHARGRVGHRRISVDPHRVRGSDGSLFTVPFSSVSTVNSTNRGLGNAAVREHRVGQDVIWRSTR